MRNSSSSSAQNRKNSFSSGGGGGGKMVLKRGPWTAEEDELLTRCINKEGEGKWRTLPERAGLARCGKSCRLRWMNYLRPSVKRGQIAPDEEDLILRLHRLLGNRWSLIAGRIPGRTDNEIKNYWNTHLSKKLISQGIDPKTHKPLLETTSTAAGSKSAKKSDDSSSWKKAITTHTHQSTTAPTTSSARNPNYMNLYSGSMEEDGFNEEDQDRQTVGELAGCYRDHGASNVEGYHVNLRPERSSQADHQGGVSNEEDIDGGMIINCEGMVEDDGVFSSFLNSLINDDMFV